MGRSSKKGLLQGGILSPLLLNFYLDQFDNHWAEIGLKSVEGNSIEHLVRFAYYFVIFSKEWINPDRVEAVLAALGLKLNKEKTYVGTVENGFEFVSFYFQEIADDNGLRNNIEIISIGWSIEKVTRNIKNITYIKKEEFRDENENQSLSNVIKNIYKVLDLWVNYYKHTDYAVGLERIEQSFNKKIQWFI